MIGTTVSHYRVIEKLGEGGMGVVYRAEDTKLRRSVALKFLPADLTRDPVAKERFVQEARAASALDHPNICTIHDIDETETGDLFISMACYDGETIKERIKRGPLTIEGTVDLALQIAAGLGKAHGKGIVHRDIKPANIFITRDDRVKILDFGLAKLANQTKLTKVGSTVGTVAYMSPEQARGRKIDPRTDIWSLGVVLYEMVSGQRPFRGEHEQAVLYSIIHEPPEPVGALRSDVPPELAAIIARCLRKDPDERYRTVVELSDDLAALQGAIGRGETSAAVSAATVAMRRSTSRATRVIAPLAAVITIILLVFFYPIGKRLLRERIGPASLPDVKYLAVLPPVVTGSPEDIVFANGLTEHLTFRLSRLEELDESFRVVPGSEVRQEGATSPELARDLLGATVALASEISRDGDAVQLDLELVATSTGSTIATHTTTEMLGNVASLQDLLAITIAESLGIEVGSDTQPTLSVGGTTVPDAFDAYVEGLGYLTRVNGRGAQNLNAAAARFEEALEADPGYALALSALGETHWRMCQATADPQCRVAAMEVLERGIELDDRLASPHVTLGLMHAAAGELKEAEREFRRALEIDPLDPLARAELADTFDAQGKPIQAKLEYQRLIEQRPAYWVGHNKLGVFHRSQGKYEDAAAEFSTVIELAPGNTTGYTNLGIIYYELERYEDCLEMLTMANEILPDYYGYSNLGTLNFQLGHYADAAAMYEKALQVDDSDYRVWGNLASSYEWVPGEHERAAGAYREAAERAEASRRVQPHEPLLLCLLGGYYAALEEKERALELTERALVLAPDDVEIMFQAGHNYEALGDRERALEWIGEALSHGYSREQCERTPALRSLCADGRFKDLVESTTG